MPVMQSYKFPDLIAELQSFDSWLHKLGLDTKQDRAHFAINILRKAEQAFTKAQSTGKPFEISDIGSDYIFGICEALEIRDIHRAFKEEKTEYLARTLERALSGPHQPAEENEKNADGRNVGFELAFAADLRLRGAAVTLKEPDLKLTIDGCEYLLACKRPLHRIGIPTAIRAAKKQLREHLEVRSDKRCGVIAISISRILNPGTLVFVEHLERFGDRIHELFLENREHCEKAAREIPGICAILLHAATPAEFNGQLVRMNYSLVHDGGVPSDVFERLGGCISQIYQSGARKL